MPRLGRYKKLFTIDGQEAQRFACRPQEGQRPKRREYRLSGFSPLLFTDGLRVQYKRFFWTVLERERARQSGAS